MAERLTLTGARFPGSDGLVDIALADGRVEAITPANGVRPEETVALDGRYVVPGLWDEHVHFTQWTLFRSRFDVSAARSAAEAAALVRGHLQADGMPAAGPLVGVGFRDAVWPDRPTAALLDEVAGSLPVVLLSADLHTAWLNTAGAQATGAAIGEDGLVREDDAFAVQGALDALPDAVVDAWAEEAADAAATRGVVGIVDLEMTWNRDVWLRRVAAGSDAIRVQFGVYPVDLDRAIAEGLRTGEAVGESGLLTMGFLKILIDGSLNTRTAYCVDPYPDPDGLPHPNGLLTVPEDELEEVLRRSTGGGILPTVHAIGDAANRVALDVFERVGTPGRIEHAQLLTGEDIHRFEKLGVIVSVQPAHAMDDRDVADHHWAGRTGRAFPFRSLTEFGARLAFGSDAPVSPLDPWVGMAAAVFRTADDRPAWHPEQLVDPQVALASSARGRATVSVGDVADLAVVEADPFTATVDQLRTMPVAATLLGGRFTHRTL
ncbi:amidohydrolase [Naasia aerilata]|uniref:Amidohydrolase n=1 Tax=Naasia aerilata TaxID=1162966 RepID=A0ABM8GDW8_9MICO|nr:amidohydrolase family protein [Naasia aerilata]BDZ46497.1 amidohydrolase [Naasia aerilata]